MTNDLSSDTVITDELVQAHILHARRLRAEMLRSFFVGLFAKRQDDDKAVPGNIATA
ncbi:MAG: hypothetical protein AAGF58_01240 [Pseudomonadota bacterium]